MLTLYCLCVGFKTKCVLGTAVLIYILSKESSYSPMGFSRCMAGDSSILYSVFSACHYACACLCVCKLAGNCILPIWVSSSSFYCLLHWSEWATGASCTFITSTSVALAGSSEVPQIKLQNKTTQNGLSATAINMKDSPRVNRIWNHMLAFYAVIQKLSNLITLVSEC